MRPPLNAGENSLSSNPNLPRGPSFNEAPAERGGKLRARLDERVQERHASMRPPLNAGENMSSSTAAPRPSRCFNEAPAERGGKQIKPGYGFGCLTGFNEAPAERGGKRVAGHVSSSDARRLQ